MPGAGVQVSPGHVSAAALAYGPAAQEIPQGPGAYSQHGQ